MNDYDVGYEQGYQMAKYIDIGIWALIGFLITKFVIGKLYKKNNNEDLPTWISLLVAFACGLIKAFMVFL